MTIKKLVARLIPVYGKTEIVLTESAFIGIVLSSAEVYKKECLGLLLGVDSTGRIIVNHAVIFKRFPKENSVA
jgi:hypothetical protein